MARNKKSFSEMVEELEDHEDVVECKECFELFPKADCVKAEHGYICPTCGRGVRTEFVPTSKDITIDLFDQDFPEYEGKTCDAGCVKDVFDALIEDEVDAIEGYEEAEAALVRAELPNKDEVEATFEHIKEEEEEHIEELEAVLGKDGAQDQLIESGAKSVYVAVDLGNNSEVIVACYAESEDEAAQKLELPFLEKTGKRGSEAEDMHIMLATEDDIAELTPEYFVESLQEHVNEEHPAIESDQELEGTDNAVVKCKAAKVVTHSEDEKPVDCKGEKKPLEKPLTENRVTAYNAAQAKANDLNQSIVYGYSSSKDGSFKELELAILEPGYEEDMENIYDDFGVLYIAYPGKTLQESLEEACNRLIERHQINESPFSSIKDTLKSFRGKTLIPKLFKAGFIVDAAQLPGTEFEISPEEKKSKNIGPDKIYETIADAESAAKAISELFKKTVFVIKPVLGPEFTTELRQQLGLGTEKYGPVIGTFLRGTQDNSSAFAKRAIVDLNRQIQSWQKLTKGQWATGSPAHADLNSHQDTTSSKPTGAPEQKPAEKTEEKPEAKTATTVKRDMSKQNQAKANAIKIIKALQNAGFDVSGLRDGKKATDKLKQLRRDIFDESLKNDYDEDEVECTWCEEKLPKSECRFEVGDGSPDGGLGWLCHRCEAAIKSRGEDLTFRENSYWDFLDET